VYLRSILVRRKLYFDRGFDLDRLNQQLAAVRRLAHEAADSVLLSPELAAGISRVKGVKQFASEWADCTQEED